jgi:putative transposase
METTNIVDFARRDGITDALTDLLRTGAQQLILSTQRNLLRLSR